jgi:hypothetical protein
MSMALSLGLAQSCIMTNQEQGPGAPNGTIHSWSLGTPFVGTVVLHLFIRIALGKHHFTLRCRVPNQLARSACSDMLSAHWYTAQQLPPRR